MDTRAEAALGQLVDCEDGNVGALLRQIEQRQDYASISESTGKRYLKKIDFRYERYRYSLKKRDQRGARARRRSDRRYGQAGPWAAVRVAVFRRIRLPLKLSHTVRLGETGQTRAVEPLAHRQRVNVL